MIDNHDAVTREVAMLDTLSDMEVANTILKATHKSRDGESVSKLDHQFNDLNMKELTALDHKSTEYKELQNLLLNTSSNGHGLRYRLQDIFRVERYGEDERYQKAISKLKDRNTFLLWHGSRTTNYGGILSRGLRIAPPGKWLRSIALLSADAKQKHQSMVMPSVKAYIWLTVQVNRPITASQAHQVERVF